MDSIVLQLQEEAMTSNSDIVSILRKAHVVATKLNLVDFDRWISLELNGYTDNRDIPVYRLVHGSLMALHPYSGLIPFYPQDKKMRDTLSSVKLQMPISELEVYSRNPKGANLSFNSSIQEIVNKSSDSDCPVELLLTVSNGSFITIVEKVKNIVLDWTLKLEKEGILGEGILFNKREQEVAQEVMTKYEAPLIVKQSSSENVAQIYKEIQANKDTVTIRE